MTSNIFIQYIRFNVYIRLKYTFYSIIIQVYIMYNQVFRYNMSLKQLSFNDDLIYLVSTQCEHNRKMKKINLSSKWVYNIVFIYNLNGKKCKYSKHKTNIIYIYTYIVLKNSENNWLYLFMVFFFLLCDLKNRTRNPYCSIHFISLLQL